MEIGINMSWYNPGTGDVIFQDGVRTSRWETEDFDYNPDFIEDMAPYSFIRFQKFHNVEFSDDVNWSDRPDPNVDLPTYVGYQEGIGAPYEIEIKLCNDLKKDFWVCVPALATDEYMQQLAQLTYNYLDSDLKVYIEYSNETWNWDYEEGAAWDDAPGYNGQYSVCNDRGMELGLADNSGEAGYLYHVYAAARIWKAFEDVFGSDNPRVVKVLASALWTPESSGDDPGEAFSEGWGIGYIHMQGLKSSLVNPHGLVPDVYAVQGYMGNGDGASPNIFDELTESTSVMGQTMEAYKQGLVNAGFPDVELVVYEGGHHVTTNGDTMSRDPRVYDLYINMFNTARDAGITAFVHYFSVWPYEYDYFGIKEYTGESIDTAHKFRAIVDWVAEND
jgi:hypothetical protein